MKVLCLVIVMIVMVMLTKDSWAKDLGRDYLRVKGDANPKGHLEKEPFNPDDYPHFKPYLTAFEYDNNSTKNYPRNICTCEGYDKPTLEQLICNNNNYIGLFLIDGWYYTKDKKYFVYKLYFETEQAITGQSIADKSKEHHIYQNKSEQIKCGESIIMQRRGVYLVAGRKENIFENYDASYALQYCYTLYKSCHDFDDQAIKLIKFINDVYVLKSKGYQWFGCDKNEMNKIQFIDI